MKEYRFVKEWEVGEGTPSSWLKYRTELNKIIKSYNKWQYKHLCDKTRFQKLLAKIEYGLQTIGGYNEFDFDSDNAYADELNGMKEYIKSVQYKGIDYE